MGSPDSKKPGANGFTRYPDGSVRIGKIVITDKNKNHGLKTLENEKEITTYDQLSSNLLEDEQSAPAEIAAIIKEIRTSLSPKDFEHVWGKSPEKSKICTIIIQLREKLAQLPESEKQDEQPAVRRVRNFVPGGY